MVVMPLATSMATAIDSRASIYLKGEGILSFLHNILTCNVNDLQERQTAYGALLSPQGKILHDIFVTNGDGKVWINCAASGRDDLMAKLKFYRLRAKFEIEAVNVAPVPVDPRHPELAKLEIFSEAYEDRRYELGIANSAEISVGKLFPHEANFDQFGGVDFKKGCYIGQEVVSRMQHRGTARNRILPITFENETRVDETEIRSNETLIGEVLGRRGKQGLALVRLDRLAEATAPLQVQNQSVSVKQ
jgi:tRNA-modifying protein YgfZ